tara:strand:+ start:1512 stop:1754 length:243 start_codon:yes stop_codon:yes gene_type:complete
MLYLRGKLVKKYIKIKVMKYQVRLKNGKNGIKLFNSVIEALKTYSPDEIKTLVEIQETDFESADGRNVSRGKKFYQRKHK